MPGRRHLPPLRSGGPLFFSEPVSGNLASFLDAANVENRNTQLEASAPVLALATFAKLLEGHDVIIFGDNKAALGAFQKGYSPSVYLCSIVAELWLRCLAMDCFP